MHISLANIGTEHRGIHPQDNGSVQPSVSIFAIPRVPIRFFEKSKACASQEEPLELLCYEGPVVLCSVSSQV